jgi:hypothetical protein
MVKQTVILLIATLLAAGCRSQNTGGAASATPASASATTQYIDPPPLDAALTVEQAYAAIPHRRTVWDDSNTTVPAGEKEYLKVIFEVMDQGVAVRVAGLQSFSASQFDSSDPAANYQQLIDFVRSMPVPGRLADFHQKILTALAGQQQFFSEWKSQREQFKYAQQVQSHPGVSRASAALRDSYNELMSKYPNESQSNKDAFFDYPCALDFL